MTGCRERLVRRLEGRAKRLFQSRYRQLQTSVGGAVGQRDSVAGPQTQPTEGKEERGGAGAYAHPPPRRTARYAPNSSL